MKPDFALSLSFEGISLLMRTNDGWAEVGETKLDVPDLAAELSALRDTAMALDAGDFTTKLIIPGEQIKFISVPTLTSVDTEAAIIDALDGATPYPVADLVYDWTEANGSICIAAVARETLQEAESFAAEHGFNPVSFVAAPERGFQGEVFFGPTKSAATILPDGQEITPDSQPTVATQPIPTAAAPAPEPQSEPQQVAPPIPETEEDKDAAPFIAVDEESEGEPSEPAESATETVDQLADDIVVPDPAPIPQVAFGTRRASPDVIRPTARPAEPAPVPNPTPKPAPAAEPTPSFASIRASRDNGAAPSAAKAPKLNGADRGAGLTATRQEAEAPPAPRRNAAPIVPPVASDYAPKLDVVPEPPAFSSAPLPQDLPDPEVANGAISTTAPAADAKPAKATKGKARFTRPTFPSLPQFGRKPKAKDAAPKPKPRILRSKAAAKAAPAAAASTIESERQRMTVFGARKPAKVGGKPRFLGLILTAILLLFLAGVAAWASVYLEDGIARLFGRQNAPTALASAPIRTPEIIRPDVEETVLPDNVQTASLSRSLDVAPETPRSELPQPRLTAQEDISPEEAEARYAATGIWQMAPRDPGLPGFISLDDIYVASIDSVVNAHDAVSLPTLREIQTDLAMLPQRLPPPPGARFKMDARGMIVPTVAGVITPEGFTLFAGRPPVLPPVRPGSTLLEPVAVTPDEVTAEMLRLAALRPKPRPDGLVETNERGKLGGRSLQELAALRPKARPAAIKEAQEAAVAEEPPSELALAASRIPRKRPGNFDRIVKRAEPREDDGDNNPSTARVAQVKPKTVSPAIPSRSSVAKQATVKNAINLRRLNLIGVYGKPSSRRALIRLASGRYKKVKVGDRIDGGRVAAIGEGELRYTKGGRTVTLKMPKG